MLHKNTIKINGVYLLHHRRLDSDRA